MSDRLGPRIRSPNRKNGETDKDLHLVNVQTLAPALRRNRTDSQPDSQILASTIPPLSHMYSAAGFPRRLLLIDQYRALLCACD